MPSVNRREFIKQAGVVTGLGCSVPFAAVHANASPSLSSKNISQLRAVLRGQLIIPEDAGYEQAKRVFYWNPETARSPVAVVQCGHEDDVLRAVEFARTHELEVAVRSGGHSHLAWGTSSGLVIDVSPLKRITIDPARQVARAQAGVFGGELARAAGTYGLAPVLGQCPGVSATGVTLGGGLSWLSGLYGACCDNLLSANLVTADAKVLNVSEETDADLFWGLRGAGANFGVTTSFEAKLHPIGTVLGGDIHFSVSDAKAVLHGFRAIMHDAPDAFQATLNLTSGERGLFIGLCHAGPEQEAENLLRKIRSIAPPTKEAVYRQPFAKLAEKAAATNPGVGAAPAYRAIQTVYRDAITDEVIDVYVDQLARATPDVVMGLSHYMHGQVCRVAPDATAFPHRKEHSIHLRVAYNWSDPSMTDARLAWGEQWRELLRPADNECIYANYQTYQTVAGSSSLFAQNYERLASLKQKYDPHNFFRRNANISVG